MDLSDLDNWNSTGNHEFPFTRRRGFHGKCFKDMDACSEMLFLRDSKLPGASLDKNLQLKVSLEGTILLECLACLTRDPLKALGPSFGRACVTPPCSTAMETAMSLHGHETGDQSFQQLLIFSLPEWTAPNKCKLFLATKLVLGLPRTRKTRVLFDFDFGSKWKFGP